MATQQNYDSFILGEDWTLTLECEDAAGAPLPLPDGSDVKWRLSPGPGLTPLLDLSTAEGITITDRDGGVAVISVTPEMQTAAGLTSRLYHHYAEAVLPDGTVSVQLRGSFYPPLP